MPTSKLTKRTIDAVISPASKQLIYWDTEIKGSDFAFSHRA